MAASQAAQVETECNVVVIPSKTIPQGIVSTMMFNPEVEPEDNKSEMENALSSVKTGQVTFAIRDSSVDGVEVKKDQFIGLDGKKIALCVPDKIECAEKLIAEMVDDMSSVLTILLGADVNEKEEKKITDIVNEKYSDDIDIDIKRGEQPVYSFIIGVE